MVLTIVSAVDLLLHSLTSLEADRLTGGNLDGLSGLGIPTGTSSTLTNLEGAEAGNLDAIALSQSIADSFENNVKSSVSLSLGHTGGLDDGSNDVVLTNSVSHDFSPFFFYGNFCLNGFCRC